MNTDPAPRSRWNRKTLLGLGIAMAMGSIGLGVWTWRTSEAQTRRPELTPAPIDGKRAYGYLQALCDVGPHPAGTEANGRYRQIAVDHFKKCGGEVREQPFKARDPDPRVRQPVAMVNIVASWFPDRTERIVVAAHYDSRPFPDQEDDPTLRRTPFLGANDPGSGVALLMEIANHLKDLNTPYGIDLVLVDGEELVYDNAGDRYGEYFLGSGEFGRLYKEGKEGRRKDPNRYVAGVVLDMVADRDLNISKEVNSVRLAPQVVREIWDVANRLKARGFVQQVGPEVLDDHLALNTAGIPTADIIDFDYRYWHKAGDTIDKLSADSLEEVGRVITAWLCMPGKGKPTTNGKRAR